MSKAWSEPGVFLDHIVSLVVPGRSVKQHVVVPTETAAIGDLNEWSNEDLGLLIEEGRATLAEQQNRFDRVRATAQVILPLASALLVIFGSQLRPFMNEGSDCYRYLLYAVWAIGTGSVLLAALGAAAVLTVRSDFGTVFPPLVSQLTPPIKESVARAYAEQVVVGETTLGTRVTVVRDTVVLLALGGFVHAVTWLVRQLIER
jgi:hypothetical protein